MITIFILLSFGYLLLLVAIAVPKVFILSKPKSYRLSAFLKHSFVLGKIIFLYRVYSYLDRFGESLKIASIL
jgi:hypothetical protein